MTDAKAAAASQAAPRWTQADLYKILSRMLPSLGAAMELSGPLAEALNAAKRALPPSGQAAPLWENADFLALLQKHMPKVAAKLDLQDVFDTVAALNAQAAAPPVEAVGQQGTDASDRASVREAALREAAALKLGDIILALEYAAEGRTNSVKPDLLGNYLNKLLALKLESALIAQPCAPAERDVPTLTLDSGLQRARQLVRQLQKACPERDQLVRNFFDIQRKRHGRWRIYEPRDLNQAELDTAWAADGETRGEYLDGTMDFLSALEALLAAPETEKPEGRR